jgi:hypothetical protein
MAGDVVLVETPAAVAQLVSGGIQAAGLDPRATIIALSPWAEYALERAGVTHQRLDSFHTIANRERLGDETTVKVAGWSAQLSRIVRDHVPALVATGLQPADSWFFWLKILHDACALRIFELQAMLTDLRPERVGFYTTPRQEPVPRRLDFMGESLYALLVPLVCATTGAEVIPLGSTPWLDVGLTRVTPWVIRQSRRIRAALMDHRNEYVKVPRSQSPARVVVDDRSLARAIAGRVGGQVTWWDPPSAVAIPIAPMRPPVLVRGDNPGSGTDLEGSLQDAWRGVEDSARFWANFEQGGVDFRGVVAGRLHHLVTEAFANDLRTYSLARAVFTRFSASCYLSANLAMAPRRVAAQAARDMDVPVAVYDHGSEGYFNIPIEGHLDQVADVRLVYGEGVVRHVSRRYPKTARPVAVGSIWLDRLVTLGHTEGRKQKLLRRLALDVGRPVVVFAPTILGSNNRYLSHLVASDSESYARELLVVNTIMRRSDVQVVVKLHPALTYPVSPIADYVAGLATPRAIVSRLPLTEVLAVADLFVTDNPTTSLLEMLTTQQRVIVLHNGVMDFEDDALPYLRAAVDLAWNRDEFEARLDEVLDTRDFTAPPRERAEFMRLYGTHLGDGRSADRVAGAVSGAVQRDDETRRPPGTGVPRH